MTEVERLECALNSFRLSERREALAGLMRHPSRSAPVEGRNVNMHFHSFFSFNAEEFSPSRIAWEAHKAGLYAAGLCDFDVLDGLEEFLEAGAALPLRVAAHLETRAFLSAFRNSDISSPGEPGVTYIMGAGFARAPQPGTPQAVGLEGYRARARERNEALIARVNARLPDLAVDYETDVLPLTPSGSATERHIVRAYVNRAGQAYGSPEALARRWSDVLGIPPGDVAALRANPPAMEEKVRSRLVKRGGIGYIQPSPETFPTVEEFTAWVRSCGAVPMVTWLDGTSDGEKNADALLACMVSLGAAALNIIPDRNWNIANAAERDLKRARLCEIVERARVMGLPINIGTEMNRRGLPFVDDLDGPVLQAYREDFLRGARILVGHQVLLRYADYSYAGGEAAADFPDTAARNAFFEAVGALPPLDAAEARRLESRRPEEVVRLFKRRVGRA